MKRRFFILDTEVVLDGPDAVVAPIAYAYGRFLAPGEAGERALSLVAGAGSIQVDGHSYPFARDSDPTLEIYQYFLDATLGRIASHAVLHAGALVDPAGGALILAGPSGHGKSSLTQALVARGWGFLSDDYAPLDLRARTVAPYPRTVGLLPGGGARTPEVFAEAARSADAPRLFEKVLVDVGRALGESAVASRPAPLRHVVLLAPEDGDELPPTANRIELTCLTPAAGEILERLRAIPGAEPGQTTDRGPVTGIVVGLDPASYPTAALADVAADPSVLFCQKYWDTAPDFEAEPRLTPVRRRLAAEFLGRELFNRTPGSRLLARYDGDVTALFLDLAAALKDADCYKLRVGRFDTAVEMIAALGEGDGV